MVALVAYVLAPLPNPIASKCCGDDDLMSVDTGASADMGYFITSFFIVSGFGIIVVLAHTSVITIQAMIMSLFGGIFVYLTLLGYIHFFTASDY